MQSAQAAGAPNSRSATSPPPTPAEAAPGHQARALAGSHPACAANRRTMTLCETNTSPTRHRGARAPRPRAPLGGLLPKPHAPGRAGTHLRATPGPAGPTLALRPRVLPPSRGSLCVRQLRVPASQPQCGESAERGAGRARGWRRCLPAVCAHSAAPAGPRRCSRSLTHGGGRGGRSLLPASSRRRGGGRGAGRKPDPPGLQGWSGMAPPQSPTRCPHSPRSPGHCPGSQEPRCPLPPVPPSCCAPDPCGSPPPAWVLPAVSPQSPLLPVPAHPCRQWSPPQAHEPDPSLSPSPQLQPLPRQDGSRHTPPWAAHPAQSCPQPEAPPSTRLLSRRSRPLGSLCGPRPARLLGAHPRQSARPPPIQSPREVRSRNP